MKKRIIFLLVAVLLLVGATVLKGNVNQTQNIKVLVDPPLH